MAIEEKEEVKHDTAEDVWGARQYRQVTRPENYPDEVTPSLVRTLKKGFNSLGIEAHTEEEVLLVLQGVTLGLVIACFIAVRARR